MGRARRNATRLIRQHRLDGSPLIGGEFVAHDSNPRFGGLESRPEGWPQRAFRLSLFSVKAALFSVKAAFGTFQTCRNVWHESAIGAQADLSGHTAVSSLATPKDCGDPDCERKQKRHGNRAKQN